VHHPHDSETWPDTGFSPRGDSIMMWMQLRTLRTLAEQQATDSDTIAR
jgi:hypothetical protein